ncbi:TerB N-terminal domain-containing protein [Xanthobacter autotrophicus DSM 431]|uniref:TerB N-terminal domain-containing protein n=1 Tax=Xanthobacter nonsaccharivorans TaxID=3119912 RepID=UPI0037289CE5
MVEAPAATALANTLADDLKERLAVHNAQVGRAIGGQISSDGSVLSSFDRNVELTAGLKTATANAPPALGDELKAKLSAPNAEVGRAIEGRNSDLASAHQARSSFMERLVGGVRRDEPAPADGWTPAGQTVRISPHVVGGGMIYVGRRLPQQGSGHQPENCLINPDLAVATRSGDPHGVTMGYWPSYSTISAEARKSYLEWLAGPRSDPGTYIGYVFLYFYGLERRLMLEKGAPDTEAVVAEVRRLLSIYGSHHSFRRYAQELLSTHEMRQALPPQTVVPDAGFAGYEVPLHIKAALGARVRDGQEIEPDLLLAYVMSHPETSVRTPAKRAIAELRELFAAAVARAHPKGIRVPMGRAKMLKGTYRACSGTFEVDIQPYGGDLPDITGRSQPLQTGRDIFYACVEQLEAYSRALGRLPGMTPNLAAIARLPPGHRRRRVEQMEGQPLSRIGALVRDGSPSAIERFIVLTGLDDDRPFGRAKLKDLAAVLAAFGYGTTADPAFSMRATQLGEPIVVFPLAAEAEAALIPSADYRRVQATIMLGMLIASADGIFDEGERRGLIARIEGATFLSEDERQRLKAELVANEQAPGRMADWMKLLKDMEAADGAWVADVLVDAAAADGRIDPKEVAMLEKLFRRLGLDEASLYARLHGGLAGRGQGRDDDLELVVPPGIQLNGPAIPPPPSVETPDESRSRVDQSRLEAIRRETRSAASVLADIFAEEEAVAEPSPPAPAPENDAEAIFEGLERRYGSLLTELSEHEEWTAADFEHLTRDAGLMPGAARQALNDWALDRFDELLIEGEDPIIVNRYLLPLPGETAPASPSADLRAPA